MAAPENKSVPYFSWSKIQTWVRVKIRIMDSPKSESSKAGAGTNERMRGHRVCTLSLEMNQ